MKAINIRVDGITMSIPFNNISGVQEIPGYLPYHCGHLYGHTKKVEFRLKVRILGEEINIPISPKDYSKVMKMYYAEKARLVKTDNGKAFNASIKKENK